MILFVKNTSQIFTYTAEFAQIPIIGDYSTLL